MLLDNIEVASPIAKTKEEYVQPCTHVVVAIYRPPNSNLDVAEAVLVVVTRFTVQYVYSIVIS